MARFFALKMNLSVIKLLTYWRYCTSWCSNHWPYTAARAGHASNVEFVKKLKKVYAKELEELWKDD